MFLVKFDLCVKMICCLFDQFFIRHIEEKFRSATGPLVEFLLCILICFAKIFMCFLVVDVGVQFLFRFQGSFLNRSNSEFSQILWVICRELTNLESGISKLAALEETSISDTLNFLTCVQQCS